MTSSQLDNLINWAKSNGAEINEKLSFKNREGRGISCIVEDQLTDSERSGLIKIPEVLTITPQHAEDFASSYLIGAQTDATSDINSNLIFLLAKLKFDKSNNESYDLYKRFQPYIDYLPKDGKSTGNPYFWDMETKELLDGTDAGIFMKRNFLKDLEAWKKIASQLDVEQYPQLKDELLEYEAFRMGPVGGVAVNYLLNIKEISWTSFTAYLWANCIIRSRAFPYILWLENDQKFKDHAFLLPIVDLLNMDDQNKSQCNWSIESNNFVFNSLDDPSLLKKGAELYNNYGSKSNVDFLLSYGFCLKDASSDVTTLSLKIDAGVIKSAKSYGVKIPEDSTDDSLNFVLKRDTPIPSDLINLFAYLVKLPTETKGFTLRMKLEGLNQLRSIIKSKISTLKTVASTAYTNVEPTISRTIKTYRKSQKDIFQQTLEAIEKLEKHLLTEFKPFSFKKAMAQDTRFFNSFLVVFGTKDYNDLIAKELVDHAVLLWIMRIANKENYSEADLPDETVLPNFIFQQFEEVKNTTEIDQDDISEYLPMYQTLFPALCEKVPSVYNRGNWTLDHLIYAGAVADNLTYKRESNGEVFFINPAPKK